MTKKEDNLFLDTTSVENDVRFVNRIAFFVFLAWTIIVSISAYSNISLYYDQAVTHAKQKAVDHFNKELAFRLWAISKGGFYLKVSDSTSPIDYLSFLDQRDVFTDDGQIITLYDPVSALKNMTENFGDLYGISGRIVGENPLNPRSLPDEWESSAIKLFQKGTKEVFEITEKDGEDHVRIIRPMLTREGCLKCHGHLGHKAGEIRAGISLSVPLKEFTESAHESSIRTSMSHGMMWLLGLLGIYLIRRQMLINMGNRHRQIADLELSDRVFEDGLQGIFITDIQGNILRVNDMYTQISGYEASEAIGQKASIHKSDKHPQEFYKEMWDTLAKKGYWSGEVWNKHKSGELYLIRENISTVKDANGKPRFYISMLQDTTLENRAKEHIFKLAHYDALTGLPNRELFLDRTNHALSLAKRHDKTVAVVFIDLDNFKQINDTLGHDAGDRLLIRATERLKSCVRSSDTLARLSGDEFGILIENFKSLSSIEHVVQKILDIFNTPISVNGIDWHIGTSIGIALNDADVSSVSEILKNADSAMYWAKENGKHKFRFYDQSISEKAAKEMELLSKIREGIVNQEFYFNYQPIIEAQSQSIVGVEALLRWNHEGETIFPDQFIPLAEESGLIADIGKEMFKVACNEIGSLRNALNFDLKLFYNVSSIELSQKDFSNSIKQALDVTTLPPERLELEITETVLMESLGSVEKTIHELKNIGVNLAIDDFGTGYSSLSYLTKLPVNVLKIDKSFIEGIPHDKENFAIVKTIISMAKLLDLKVVSEGVEEDHQLSTLKDEGIDCIQGYFISKPLTFTDLQAFLKLRKNG